LASRQAFGELKTEQLGGHSQEQQRHRQAPIDDDDDDDDDDIGDDTKAPARQSSNCIKIPKNMTQNDFQHGGWNYYTLQCGTIVTLISPGDCTLQCGMWLWNHGK